MITTLFSQHLHRSAKMALLVPVLITVLTGCSEAPDEGAKNAVPLAQRLPDNAELAAIYQQSCANCHAVVGSQAPLTGEATWQPRLTKGLDVLLANTINGFNGMPPLGMCFQCDETQFRALIEFMATPAKEQGK
jgi:cytochrome c5